MATPIVDIVSRARITLMEITARFWTDAELTAHIVAGIHDLWGAILDLHQEHFFVVDETHVTIAANAKTLSGVPTDVLRVMGIEPLNPTPGGGLYGMVFVPRKYASPEFRGARAGQALDRSAQGIVYYDISQAGAPVGAPTVHIAPVVSGVVPLRFIYLPTIIVAADNPIPGQSDNALVAYCIAWARSKEREDRSPDPAFISVYSAEKTNILTRLTPRQEDEPEVVPDFFGAW